MRNMVLYIAAAFYFGWLCVLTWIVFKTRSHYMNLISKTRKERIDDILDELLKTDQRVVTDIEQVKKDLKEEMRKSQFHLQKIGLLRFNPFERTGGEQSFVIAILDAEDSGVVLNFIYTREGLRVYTKKIRQGKGDEYELSDEEKKAIERSVSTGKLLRS